jgi:hypothetical protein
MTEEDYRRELDKYIDSVRPSAFTSSATIPSFGVVSSSSSAGAAIAPPYYTIKSPVAIELEEKVDSLTKALNVAMGVVEDTMKRCEKLEVMAETLFSDNDLLRIRVTELETMLKGAISTTSARPIYGYKVPVMSSPVIYTSEETDPLPTSTAPYSTISGGSSS